jgi:predicted MFS family arabinose efflux permease
MAIIAAGLPYLLPLGGLPIVFVFHGVGMAAIALLLIPLLPKDLSVEARRLSYWHEHRVIYSAARLLAPGAGFVWYTLIYIALLAVLPLALGLPVWVMTGLPLISIFGTLAGGVIAKRISPAGVVTIGFLGTVASSVILWLLPGALWPLFLLFAVMALIPAGSFALIPHINRSTEDRARATGGLAQLGNVGTTLGTPIFVLAHDAIGFGAVTALIAGFCITGLVVTQGLQARIK